MKKHFVGMMVMGVLAGSGSGARAQVFIKPSSSKAVALRVQKLSADVDIIGGVAVTNWTMTAHLEKVGFSSNYEGTVCEFYCARPVDAKVTAFSVQQDRSTLNGRVVESAIAAPRVAFRTAPDDPLARSGLNASNSFHATIYPLDSWNTVTFRGTWVQLLGSSRRGATFRLPLLSLKGATMRVPELNVKVFIRDGAWDAVSNSYELPTQTQNGARVVSLAQKNYRLLRDFSLALKPSKSLSGLPMLSSADEHFALAFIAPKTLRNVRVTGAGIDSSSVSKSVRAGEVVLLSGQYHSNGRSLSPVLSAEGLGADLPLDRVQNEAARSLWATQKINVLSKNAKANRAQITTLSKQFSVVSPFTSWLSVGDEDLRIYRRAQVSNQLDPLVREYWIRLASGQSQSARAVRLKRAITRISAGNGLNVQNELDVRLGSAVNYAASVGWIYSGEPKTAAQKRFVRLQKFQAERYKVLGVKAQDNGGGQKYFETREELASLREKIREELRKPHPNFAQLEALNARFARLYGLSEPDPRLALFRTRIEAQNLEIQTRAAQAANDQTRVAKLEEERKQNSNGLYFTNNIGDPPIYVEAPASARSVVAVMPDGQVKTLAFNPAQKRWEGNYDVPVGTRDGDYEIQIIIVGANGSRTRRAMPFRVDTTAPRGKSRVVLSPDKTQIRLEVEGSGDVAFVQAIFPWGEKLSLLPSTQEGNAFFGLARVPKEFAGQPIKVNYILIDRAHNTSSLEAATTSTP